jgi:hypothetical protein
MITFNVFARFRYLPSFFGIWTLEIVPILDNMVYKVIDYHDIAANTCAHVNKETVFQFYNMNIGVYLPYIAADNPLEHWIQFQA